MPLGRMRVLAPDAAIQRRREMEDRLVTAKTFVEEQQKVASAAQWEERAQLRGESMAFTRQLEEAREARQADVERRSAQLAEKLRKEELQIQAVLLSRKEEASKRRQSLVSKAQGRAAEREAERQKLVDQLRDLQFRESCDAVRHKQSQQRQKACIQQQQLQVEDKRQQLAMSGNADRLYDQEALSNETRLTSEYEKALQERRSKYLQIKSLLDEQVLEHQKQQQADARSEFEERAAQRQEWKQNLAAERAEAREEALAQRQAYAEMQRLNREKQEEKADIRAAERKADSERLHDALQKESEAVLKDAIAKRNSKQAAIAHRKALEAMLNKEAKDTAEADEMIDQANRVKQAREDKERAAHQAARAKLMAEVSQTRLQQIHQQALCKEQLAGERKAELERLERENAASAALEVAEAERLMQDETRYRLELQGQIAAKQQTEALQRLRAAEELTRARQAEEEYQRRTQAVLETSDPPTDFRRKKVDWC